MLEFDRHVATSTLDIAYADTGPADGPVVFLMHGWPDAARTWNDVAARLNDAGYRTIVPELRGAGGTRFLTDDAARDGSAVALVHDAIELMEALEIDAFDFVGHDWGACAAYTIAALYPERVRRIAALSVGYQPSGAFDVPDFAQSRRWWYQWFMSLDAGPKAVAADPKGVCADSMGHVGARRLVRRGGIRRHGARFRESGLGADHAQCVSAALAHGRSVRSGAVRALSEARRGREDRCALARDSRRRGYVHRSVNVGGAGRLFHGWLRARGDRRRRVFRSGRRWRQWRTR